jgi:hypothetical protein
VHVQVCMCVKRCTRVAVSSPQPASAGPSTVPPITRATQLPASEDPAGLQDTCGVCMGPASTPCPHTPTILKIAVSPHALLFAPPICGQTPVNVSARTLMRV